MEYKKLIKFAIIALSIITIIVIGMIVYLSKKTPEMEKGEAIAPEGELILDKSGVIVQNFNQYNTVKNCINNLILYAGAGNYSAIEEIVEGDYIFQNKDIDVNTTLILDPIYRVDNESGNVNFVSFRINKQSSNIYGIVILDGASQTFKILKASETDYNNAKKHNIDSRYKEYIKIDAKKFNKYKYSILTEEEIAKQYFNNYIQKAMYYPQEAYNALDEEYKTKKFPTFSEFQSYLTNFQAKGLKQYLVKDYPTYKVYICIDDYENYYAFKVTAAMQYSVYLDDYTILIANDLDKYNSSTNKQKATINVKRFLKAINEEDYVYAYSKFSEGFKENYFKELKTFENYTKKRWIDYNNIKNVTVKEESDIYICEVKTNSEITMKFNVRLSEGQEYQISFKVEGK